MKTKLLLLCWILSFSLRAQSLENKHDEEVVASSSESNSPLMMLRIGEQSEQHQKDEALSVEEKTAQARRGTDESDQNGTASTAGNATTSLPLRETTKRVTIPSREELRTRMQSSIAMTATIHAAGDILQQQQEVKRNLARDYPEVDWNSSSDLDALIKEELLKKYKRELAVELRQRNSSSFFSPAEDQRIAEGSQQTEVQRIKRRKELAERETLIAELNSKKESLQAKIKELELIKGKRVSFNPIRAFRMNRFDPASLFSPDEMEVRGVVKDCQKLYQAAIESAIGGYREALENFEESQQEAINGRDLELVLLRKEVANKMEEMGGCFQQGASAFGRGDSLLAARFVGRGFFTSATGRSGPEVFQYGGPEGCTIHIIMCFVAKLNLLEKKTSGYTVEEVQLTSSSEPVQSLWIEAIVTNDEAMQSFELAMKAYQTGDIKEGIKKGDCLGGSLFTIGAGSAFIYASRSFQASALSLEKSELSAGVVSDAWKEASGVMSNAAALYIQAAEACKNENMLRAGYLSGTISEGAAAATAAAAAHLGKRANYLEEGKVEEAEGESQKAKRQLERAEAYKRGDRATGDSMKDNGECVIS